MAAGVDDLAVNLVASAMFEGIKRPIHSIRSFNARRQEISDAFKGSRSKPHLQDAKIEKAFLDLIQVLGNEYGLYTKQVDRFLIELRTSAVPSAIYGLLICGKSADDIKPAFETIYETFSPLPFMADDLFRALTAAISARIEQALGDPGLAEVIRANTEDLRRQIAEITASLRQAKDTDPLDSQTFLDARSRIARAVEVAHRDLPVETERGTRRINISRLVIPARLRAANRNALASVSPNIERGTVTLEDFKANLHRAVVLGDPGGGKTTLTQFLCYAMAKKLNIDVISNPSHVQDKEFKIPLKIAVRSFDRKQKSSPGYTVIDFLRDEFRTCLDNDGELTEKFIRYVLTTGKAFIFFDGLDEVLEVGRRREVASTIEQFLQVYAACPAIITSRIVGYNDAPLPDEFDIFLLTRLSRAEVQKYTEKLIRAVGASAKEASSLAAIFIRQTEHTASDLRENPLLLGLMVYIFKERGDVPDNRPAIYQACSQLLFLKWDQRRDILVNYPEDFELLDLFGYLAVKIFGDADAEDGVSEEWLLNEIKSFFNEWYSDKARATRASKALVEFITGRAWVMCDVGPRVFKFTHRTFMEYFVARRLESESESVGSLFNEIYPKIINAEWDVVSHLALQIASSSGPKAIRAIDAMEDVLDKRRRTSDQELNLLMFCSRSLEYLSVPEEKYRLVVQNIMQRASLVGAVSNIKAISVFTNFGSAGKRSKLYGYLLSEFIASEIGCSDISRKRFARFLLATKPVDALPFDMVAGTIQQLDVLSSHLASLRSAQREFLYLEAQTGLDEARLYLMTYDTEWLSLLKIHGRKLLFDKYDYLAPENYNFLKYIYLSKCLKSIGGNSNGDAEIAESVILVSHLIMSNPDLRVNQGNYPIEMRKFLGDILDGLFRNFFHSFRMAGRKSQKIWASSFLVLLGSIDSDALALSRPQRQRPIFATPRGMKFAKRNLVNRFIPPDLFLEMVNLGDRTLDVDVFSKWANGELNFVTIE